MARNFRRTLLFGLGAILLAGAAQAAVVGSPHDLRGTIGGSQVCVACHTPHGARPAVPLWNHSLPSPGDLTDTTTTISGAANLGTDLTNDHPVNFTFDAALIAADGELQAPTNAVLFGPSADQPQCGSCHDAHDNTNAPFLVMTNAGSALCLDCHVK